MSTQAGELRPPHGRGKVKLDYEKAARIRVRWALSQRWRVTLDSLAREYGVGRTTILAVLQGKTWNPPLPGEKEEAL